MLKRVTLEQFWAWDPCWDGDAVLEVVGEVWKSGLPPAGGVTLKEILPLVPKWIPEDDFVWLAMHNEWWENAGDIRLLAVDFVEAGVEALASQGAYIPPSIGDAIQTAKDYAHGIVPDEGLEAAYQAAQEWVEKKRQAYRAACAAYPNSEEARDRTRAALSLAIDVRMACSRQLDLAGADPGCDVLTPAHSAQIIRDFLKEEN